MTRAEVKGLLDPPHEDRRVPQIIRAARTAARCWARTKPTDQKAIDREIRAFNRLAKLLGEA
jgi:macrodomain Ter protein organizer (MatP/YcbG family)